MATCNVFPVIMYGITGDSGVDSRVADSGGMENRTSGVVGTTAAAGS